MKHKTVINEPQMFHVPIDRRRFFKSMAVASAGWMLPGYLAEALTYAPEVTQGPYYPLASNIPLDKDNDLIYLNDNLTAATGHLCSRARAGCQRRSSEGRIGRIMA